MNCCNSHGECTQGRDCPIRKQRTKEANDAYINRGGWGKVADPYDDVSDTFKTLLAMMAVVLCGWVLYLLIWGK